MKLRQNGTSAGAAWRRWFPAVPERIIPSRRRYFWQAVVTCGLLVVPVSAAAWQAGTANDGEAAPDTQSADKASSTLQLQAVTGEASSNEPAAAEPDPSAATPESTGSSTADQHVSVQTTHSSSSSSQTSSSVTVNGRALHVPASGEVHKTIKQDGGQTKVDISVDGGSGAAQAVDDSSTSSINVQINSSTNTNQDSN